MKVLSTLFLCLMASQLCFSQKAAEALQEDLSLRERYGVMKSKSQTYGEYKVIKETVLDGVWKIFRDSVAVKEESLRVANGNVRDLQAQLDQVNATLKEKELSMAAILHDSTHISVFGIEFGKGTFITVVTICIVGLLVFLGLMIGRMKLQSHALSERNLAVSALTSEFDEYKQRAMDKQTKLSRELQDERNKLQAIIRNS